MTRMLLIWIVVAAGVTGSASAREVVGFKGGVAPGTIVVKTAERRLYFVRLVRSIRSLGLPDSTRAREIRLHGTVEALGPIVGILRHRFS